MTRVEIEVDQRGDIVRGELCEPYAPFPLVGLIAAAVFLWGVIFGLVGCTFQVGVGYHGKTGIDDREASQLVARPVVYDEAISAGKRAR